MNKTLLLSILACAISVAALSVSLTVRRDAPDPPNMSEEQRKAREKFFGTGKALPPIPKGQEMRPRWQ